MSGTVDGGPVRVYVQEHLRWSHVVYRGDPVSPLPHF